jgi:hypothetical protein
MSRFEAGQIGTGDDVGSYSRLNKLASFIPSISS